MSVLPPRPRFHVVLWSQFIGAAMVVSGVIPYWLKWDKAWLPETVYYRAVTSAGILLLMCVIPLLVNSWDSVLGAFDRDDDHHHSERFANNRKIVRIFIWSYCIFDLCLLTYLVHITGGLTGSMYSGLFLLVPALALLLMLSSEDLSKVPWLITFSMMLIGFAYWMCDMPGRIESNASEHKAAFSLATALISWEAAILLFIQVAILKRQMAATK